MLLSEVVMKRRRHIFGYEYSPTGATIFALGFGMLTCTTLEAMDVAFPYRCMVAVLLMAGSGGFVRRRTAAQRPTG